MVKALGNRPFPPGTVSPNGADCNPLQSGRNIQVKDLHPGRLTWNLQITHLDRKMIFQTFMIMFHVNLPGCIIICPAFSRQVLKQIFDLITPTYLAMMDEMLTSMFIFWGGRKFGILFLMQVMDGCGIVRDMFGWVAEVELDEISAKISRWSWVAQNCHYDVWQGNLTDEEKKTTWFCKLTKEMGAIKDVRSKLLFNLHSAWKHTVHHVFGATGFFWF